MVDFLAELFDQFDPEEQARIRAAEDAANGILAQGTAGVRDRQLAAGSTDLTDWVLSQRMTRERMRPVLSLLHTLWRSGTKQIQGAPNGFRSSARR